MQFVMFKMKDGRKVGINKKRVVDFYEVEDGGTAIVLTEADADPSNESKFGSADYIEVDDDFDTVLSRLNTIAE